MIPPDGQKFPSGFTFVKLTSMGIGVLLYASAWLKLYSFSSQSTEDYLFDSHLVTHGVLMVEFVLAGCLISGLFRISALKFSCVTFFAFVLVSTYRVLRGDSDCGCFGSLKVPPELTLSIDLLVLVALIFAVLFSGTFNIREFRSPWLLLAWCSASLLASFLVSHQDTIELTELSRSKNGRLPIVTLRPSRWEGELLPIIEFIKCDFELESGQYSLIFVSQDCEDCRKLVEQLASEPHLDTAGLEIVLVDISSNIGFGTLHLTNLPLAQLSSEARWVMPLPSVVRIHDGVVSEYQSGKSSINQLLDRLRSAK
jgi:hypothetical protein